MWLLAILRLNRAYSGLIWPIPKRKLPSPARRDQGTETGTIPPSTLSTDCERRHRSMLTACGSRGLPSIFVFGHHGGSHRQQFSGAAHHHRGREARGHDGVGAGRVVPLLRPCDQAPALGSKPAASRIRELRHPPDSSRSPGCPCPRDGRARCCCIGAAEGESCPLSYSVYSW